MNHMVSAQYVTSCCQKNRRYQQTVDKKLEIASCTRVIQLWQFSVQLATFYMVRYNHVKFFFIYLLSFRPVLLRISSELAN